MKWRKVFRDSDDAEIGIGNEHNIITMLSYTVNALNMESKNCCALTRQFCSAYKKCIFSILKPLNYKA